MVNTVNDNQYTNFLDTYKKRLQPTKISDTENQPTRISDTENQPTKISDTNINNITINKKKKINSKINQSLNKQAATAKPKPQTNQKRE